MELLALLEESPGNLRASALYLEVLDRLGEYAPLIQHASATLEQHPRFIPAILYRSRAYAAVGQPGDTIVGYQALADRPELLPEDRIFVLETLADVCIQARRYPAALEASKRLLALRPGFRGWFRKGLALDGLDQPEEAENAYRRSLELAGNAAQRLEALRAISEACFQLRKWAQAKEALRQALDMAPQDIPLLRSLAGTEYQLKNYEGAVARLRQLLTLRKDSSDREFLANILMAQKAWAAAEQQFAAILAESVDPHTGREAYRTLSRIAESKGEPGRSADS